MAHVSRRHLGLCCAVGALAVIAVAPAARGDDVVGALPSSSAVAAYGGDVAWWAPGTGGYRLMISHHGVTSTSAAPPSPTPPNLTAGPDSHGKTVFLYTRCGVRPSSCRVYRYAPASGREQRLSGFPADTTWVAQWRDRYAFSKAVSVKGLEGTARCDLPYARSVSSSHARKLDRGRCGEATGLTLRGTAIAETVDASAIHAGDPRFTSQLRLLAAGGGAVKVVRTANSGEESNAFAGPQLSAAYAYATHIGMHPTQAFVRVSRHTLKATELAANLTLLGPLAVDGSAWAYVSEDQIEGGCSALHPCRVITTTNPFGTTTRLLPPQLTLRQSSTSPRATQAFGLGGTLTSKVVVRGRVTGTQGVGGVRVDLGLAQYAATPGQEVSMPTGLAATTAADGSWAITVPPPIPPAPFYAASAATTPVPTIAPETTVGTAVADVTMSIAPAALPAGGGSVIVSGTIDPAQPGRSIVIQVPKGATPTTLATAPLSADGRSFSVAVPLTATTSLVAVLPFVKLGQPGAATSYSGRSPTVTVAVG